MKLAIFLDRDGVIIQNRENYVLNWDEVVFIPAALEALRLLSHSPYQIVIISNQSAIGRGIITLDQAETINQQIIEKINQDGGRIDGSFICPHSPHDHCSCRKPLPGLLLQAADALSIDLSASYMIGDSLTDIEAGIAAGIKKLFLVQTGRGQAQLNLPEASLYPDVLITKDIFSAVRKILGK